MGQSKDEILDTLVSKLYSKPYDKEWSRSVIKEMAAYHNLEESNEHHDSKNQKSPEA